MRLGPHRRISCPVGGNTPQYLVEVLGGEIAEGRADVILIVGAESGHSARKINDGAILNAPPPPPHSDESLGDARPGLSEAELSVGLSWSHEVYPIFESAIAARCGRDFDAQRDWLGAVDMAAAFILMAAEVADQLGICHDRCVFPWSAATCNDVYFPIERPDLSRSSGIRVAAQKALDAVGLTTDDDPHIAEAMAREMYVGKTVLLRPVGPAVRFELP